VATTSQTTIAAAIVAQVRADLIKNLRAALRFSQYATQGTIDAGHGTLVFPKYDDLSESATTLADDGTNPTSEALVLTTYTVTPSEIGRVVSITRRARAISPHDLIAVSTDLLSYDAARRVDTIISTAAYAGGTVRYSGSASSRATTSANIVAADVRKMVTKLKSQNAIPFGDNNFQCVTDPFVTADLMAEAGSTTGSWVDSNRYATPEQIKMGVVGKLFGANFTESTQAPVLAAAGSSSADVYVSHFFGVGGIGAGKIEDVTPTYVPPTPTHGNALGREALVGYRLDMGATALNSSYYGRFESAATAL